MFSMFAADLIAQHGAFDLRLFRHIDDQYAIGLAGQAVFDQQRYDPEEIRGGGGLHLAARFLLNQRVQQRIEPCFFLHVSKIFPAAGGGSACRRGQSSVVQSGRQWPGAPGYRARPPDGR